METQFLVHIAQLYRHTNYMNYNNHSVMVKDDINFLIDSYNNVIAEYVYNVSIRNR